MPETLLDVIGGYSYAEYEATANFIDENFGQNYGGYHVGAGIEAMLTDNLTARAEYRFAQYGKEDWGVDGLDVEPSSHTGTIGVAWLFNSL